MQDKMAGLPTTEELRELHRIRFGRLILEIFLLYFLILSAIQIAILANSFWVNFVMFILIGCFQNGMIAWVHEGSHSSFNRNKKINDQMADFIFGPFGVSMDQYRWHHVAHHKYLGDPDQEIVVMTWTSLKGIRLWTEVLKHLSGV